MKPNTKNLILIIVILSGFLFTYGCGHSNYSSDSYKAEESIGDNNSPATATNTAASPAEMSVGDVYTVTFDGKDNGTINFEGTDNSAQFILAISAIDTNFTAHTVQLSDENAEFAEQYNVAAADENKWKDWSTREAFDAQLRGAETVMSLDKGIEKAAPFHTAVSTMKAMLSTSAPAVGDTESFKVLAGLSSLSSYKTVEAEIKCIGSNVIFYVDKQVEDNNSSDLTDADVETLCAEFDSVASQEIQMFGEPSDVNSDGHVAVLMTPQVNKLGAMGGGIITGFFFANDLYRSANSNAREIIYVMVPDSAGVYGMSIPKSFAMENLLPAVLPHELQHAINYNQKVFVAGGTAEENWLNEGLSHLAEDILGYGQENPSRIEVYLDDTAYYGPITSGAPGLAERGAIYLLLRYLYEQSENGETFVWNLLHSEKSGVAGLEEAFGGTSEDFDQISEFLLRWASTLVMSGYNISTDPRFSYKDRVWNAETEHWEGICLNCNADDGRGTVLSGVSLSQYYGVSQIDIEPSAVQFYKITSFPQEISMTAKTSGSYGAT
ncbi:MAG: hypothetical protein HYU98_00560, partial [Deltaproteobacteria bacterium]|nr:hypothetical protein [Deltaproteobacteria bacterium]